MKKILIGIIIGVGFTLGTSALADSTGILAKIGSFKFLINGQAKEIKSKILVVDGTSYLPVREISTLLGYNVEFADGTIGLSNDGKKYLKETTATKVTNDGGGKILLTNYLDSDGKIDLDKIKTDVDSSLISVNDHDSVTGETLLMLAIRNNNYALYSYLDSKGVDFEGKNNLGQTPLHIATIEDIGFYLGELATKHKVKVDVKDNSGKMPIDYAKPNSSTYIFLRNSKVIQDIN